MVFAFYEHAETWSEYKTSSTKRDKRNNLLKFFLLWGIPILTMVSTIMSGYESVSSDRELKKLGTNVELAKPENQPIQTVVAEARLLLNSSEFGVVGFDVSINGGVMTGTPTAQSTVKLVGATRESAEDVSGGRATFLLAATKIVVMRVATNLTVVNLEFGNSLPGFVPSGVASDLNRWDALVLVGEFTPVPGRLQGGSITVRVNSTVSRQYDIPPQPFDRSGEHSGISLIKRDGKFMPYTFWRSKATNAVSMPK